ncbi:hypothetical protein HY004_02255 [Candidatus Saccharibacteria bacterium]|nr:hypothetical protein [Candidatus Saccharibacteria bacterium]
MPTATESVFEQKDMQEIAVAALLSKPCDAPVVELHLDGKLYVGEYYKHRCKANSIPGILVLRCRLVSELPASPHLYLGVVIKSDNTWHIPNEEGISWAESTGEPSIDSLLHRGIIGPQD